MHGSLKDEKDEKWIVMFSKCVKNP